tara:strand:+ start:2404 stop:2832 length:429 start_codon:yes stop_codon:yes gene_type:complete
MEDKEFFKKWVEALRSGKYKQTTNGLYDQDEGAYCALGVGCMVAGITDPMVLYQGVLPSDLIDYNDLTDLDYEQFFEPIDSDFSERIIGLNDSEEASFVEIAQFIEDYAKHVLKQKEASLATIYNYISLYEVKIYNYKGDKS